LANFFGLRKTAQLYAELYPELDAFKVTQMRSPPKLPFGEESLSLDALDQLYESFEVDFSVKKIAIEPVLTNTQRNKLRSLPTQAEIGRWIKLRWPTDIRVDNVGTMLDSSKPVLIPVSGF
jgi:hypothetical protein